MNDKEKKAIDMCRLLLNGDITLHVIDDDGGTAYAGTVNKTYNDDLQTVLNLIEKQKEEIEKKDNIINNSIIEIEKLRQYFSEDLQVEFIRILEILKDKKVIDW